jgi:hypothetical protein
MKSSSASGETADIFERITVRNIARKGKTVRDGSTLSHACFAATLGLAGVLGLLSAAAPVCEAAELAETPVKPLGSLPVQTARQVVLSDDAARLACVVEWYNKKLHVLCDGVAGPPHGRIYVPTDATAAKDRLRYVAVDNDQAILVEFLWPKETNEHLGLKDAADK